MTRLLRRELTRYGLLLMLLGSVGWFVEGSGADEGKGKCDVQCKALLERVDEYYQYYMDREYKSVMEMWCQSDLVEATKEENLRTIRKSGRSIKLQKWNVSWMEMSDVDARVSTDTTVKGRDGLFSWREYEETNSTYWARRGSKWCFLPMKPSEWSSDASKRVKINVVSETKPKLDVKVTD